MTIGYTGAWTSKAGLLVQDTGSTGKPVSRSTKVKQMLALVGNDPNVLDRAKMDKLQIHKQLKGFNPESVSARSLGNLSSFLKERGLISDVTALTLSNAGESSIALEFRTTRKPRSMRSSTLPRNWTPSRPTTSRVTSTPTT